MKASRIILLRKLRSHDLGTGTHFAILPWLFLYVFILLFLFSVVSFALLTQFLPPLEDFDTFYQGRLPATRFYDREGKTLLWALEYENFSYADLSLCEEDGEGCFPNFFVRAVRAEKTPAEIVEIMLDAVYKDSLSDGPFPNLRRGILGAQIRQKYGDEVLLSAWLNHAWFGQMSFGLDAAAHLYLNKSGDSLTEAESVLMSALLMDPRRNPIDSKGAVKETYLSQIEILEKKGVLTAEEGKRLSNESFVIFSLPEYRGRRSPDPIVRGAMDVAVRDLGREAVERGGMDFFTTEDAALQKVLTCLIAADGSDFKRCNDDTLSVEARELIASSAVEAVILDNRGGEVLAMAAAYIDGAGNRVVSQNVKKYPLGTMINPFVALAAFTQGNTPSTLFWDLQEDLKDLPSDYQNSDGIFHGPESLRKALTADHLIPLNELLRSVGTKAVKEQIDLLGSGLSRTDSENGALMDDYEIDPLSLAFLLQTFANSGLQNGTPEAARMRPRTLFRASDPFGNSLELQPSGSRSQIASGLAYLVNDVFSAENTALDLIGRPAAFKQGKVWGDESAWASGYTPQLTCVVHIESDDPMAAGAAEALWAALMRTALKDLSPEIWEMPEDVSRLKVCLPSGKLPTADCLETAPEIFLKGSEPYEYDDFYVRKTINKNTQLLATLFTPNRLREEKVYQLFPQKAASWAADSGAEMPPTEYDSLRPQEKSVFTIISPADFSQFDRLAGTPVEISVDISGLKTVKAFQVDVGTGMDPESWVNLCSGEGLQGGQWLLCKLDASQFEDGLHALRIWLTDPQDRFYSQNGYFIVHDR